MFVRGVPSLPGFIGVGVVLHLFLYSEVARNRMVGLEVEGGERRSGERGQVCFWLTLFHWIWSSPGQCRTSISFDHDGFQVGH